jgi:Rha family phage regulatory protein
MNMLAIANNATIGADATNEATQGGPSLVEVHDGHLVTDSLRVAAHFEKDHSFVLKAIRRLSAAEDIAHFTAGNFALSEYKDSTGRTLPLYLITKDGFVMLAMGFTGRQARALKVAYIGAFNSMAEQVQTQSLGLWQQRQALEMRDMNSFVRAQFGSRLMLDRKGIKPVIAHERAQLEALMQPALLSASGEAA